MSNIPFPEKTLRSRLLFPIPLPLPSDFGRPGELEAALLSQAGWLLASRRGVALYDAQDGLLLAQWPEKDATQDWLFLPFSPLLFMDSVVAFDPSGEVVHVLSLPTLKPLKTRRIDTFDLPLDTIGRRVVGWGKANEKQLVAQLAGTREGRPVSIVVLIDESGKTLESMEFDLHLEPKNWIALDGAFIGVAKDAMVILGRGARAQTRRVEPLEGGPYDLLSASPDGRHFLICGDGAERFMLFETKGLEDRVELHLRFSGCYIIPGSNHNGGWIFWDQDTPRHFQLMPTPLWRPHVAWHPSGEYLVLGDAQGFCTLIQVPLRKAVKIMTPPQTAVWPLGFLSPRRLTILNGQVLGRLNLDWDLGNEESGLDEEGETPSPQERGATNQAPAKAKKACFFTDHCWLVYGSAALLGAGTMALIWFKWLRHFR